MAATPEDTLIIETSRGPVTVELRPDLAPNHVARIKELARQGFYDGVVFHRVIDGFMAQTGDPTGTGRGGSGQKLRAEFSKEPHTRGAVSMARAQSPDSADSQFFICFDDARFLDGQYTVWGRVTGGMENVDKITRGEPPAKPDKIVSMRVASYCVWALLAGCPAEQLGIPVPHEGIEAIAMEDVVRDVTKLSRAPSDPDRLAFLDERWRQMGLDPREGGRCGFRSGSGPEAIAVIAPAGTSSPRDQAPTAVVISVAKAFHGRPADARGVWFCVGPPPTDVEHVRRTTPPSNTPAAENA